jgi:hypothetical protein
LSCTGIPDVPPEEIMLPMASTLKINDDLEAQHKILLAFESAYPDKINSVEFLNNDWTMLVRGKRFYYAQGRFLPEALKDGWEEYLPYDFYQYPWAGTFEERKIIFDHPVYSTGSSFLFDTLYTSSNEDDSWDAQEKYSFLGVKLLIHRDIKNLLDHVAAEIQTARQTDLSIDEWIAELQTNQPTLAWSYREISGTHRRSYHSYGIAIDLLPKNLQGRLTYWQWGANESIDPNTYYLPPETVIKIFEDHGFIWGGKWDLIDTMHFEYRPEILVLNDIEMLYFENDKIHEK